MNVELQAARNKIEELQAEIIVQRDTRNAYKARMLRAEHLLRRSHVALEYLLYADQATGAVNLAHEVLERLELYFAGDL